jgi:hypothetical protein
MVRLRFKDVLQSEASAATSPLRRRLTFYTGGAPVRNALVEVGDLLRAG